MECRNPFQSSDLLTALQNVLLLKEQVVDFPPQPVITKDNVTMRIDTVYLLSDHGSKAVCIWC